MRLLRFMSAAEAIRLLDGATIENRTRHDLANRSNSIGACFAIADQSVSEAMAIYQAAQHLSGITDMHVCFAGTAKDSYTFNESHGHYRIGKIDEMCTTQYSLDDFSSWKVYAPILPGPDVLLRLVASLHWQQPILIRSSADAK